MASTDLDERLRRHRGDLVAVADLTAQALLNAVLALRFGDEKAAITLAKGSELIHEGLATARNAAQALLAAESPEGRGWNFLKAVPNVCLELGRIAGYAQAIAQLAARPDSLEVPALLTDLEYMATGAASFLRQAIRAFTNQDPPNAQAAGAQMALLETLSNQIYCEGLDLIAAEPVIIDRVRLLLSASHNLQCVARRTGRICEQTFSVVRGERTQVPTLALSDLAPAA